jgi:hypothetical protein
MSRFVAILGVLLVGCADQRAEMAARQKELVGMSKKDLLQCAGDPPRLFSSDGYEFLTFPGGDERRYCQLMFVLKDDVVQEVNHTGPTGGLLPKGEQCGLIVDNCLNQQAASAASGRRQ